MLRLCDPQQPSSSCMNSSSSSDENIDRSETWVQQVPSADAKSDQEVVPTPMLQQLAASRHQLASIMNADTIAVAAAAALVGQAVVSSKSSLAFILGGNTDENQAQVTGTSFANLTVDSSVFATENRAADVPATAAAAAEKRAAVKRSRICKFQDCTRYVVNRGLCIGHGGGKRCAVVGCTSSAKNLGVCWKHGGSTQCTMDGCENRAKSRGVCWSHGGGRKCSDGSCSKTAVSNGLCWAHGGGKRCVVEGCRKPAYERNGNVCSLHQATSATALQTPDSPARFTN
uniref:WRKY19-like zinc finger domain-containing protein n=1 Tax=Peronospora matthiolae TaxID=2874970 RepID=A0AAV1V4T2_9STRA